LHWQNADIAIMYNSRRDSLPKYPLQKLSVF